MIDCENTSKDIIAAIQKALLFDWNKAEQSNPYEKADTSGQIVSVMKQTLKNGINRKKFYDMTGAYDVSK